MKKSGFTLAEVLITLGIIGVVSAVTLPTLMSNSQYKQLGVKLSKFHSTLENSALAWVTSADEFSFADVDYTEEFINSSYMFKEVYDSNGTKLNNTTLSINRTWGCPDQEDKVGINGRTWGILKDGTAIAVCQDNSPSSPTYLGLKYPADKFGKPVFRISIQPNISGIPSNGQKVFEFTVTQKGYVFPVGTNDPSSTHPCLNAIYDNDWNVKQSWFKNKDVCTHDAWT